MIIVAQAVVKEVNQNEVVFEVSCLGATKTVVESLVGRNPMLGWGQPFQAGQEVFVDISTSSDLLEEVSTEPWRISSIKQLTPELVCETDA